MIYFRQSFCVQFLWQWCHCFFSCYINYHRWIAYRQTYSVYASFFKNYFSHVYFHFETQSIPILEVKQFSLRSKLYDGWYFINENSFVSNVIFINYLFCKNSNQKYTAYPGNEVIFKQKPIFSLKLGLLKLLEKVVNISWIWLIHHDVVL